MEIRRMFNCVWPLVGAVGVSDVVILVRPKLWSEEVKLVVCTSPRSLGEVRIAF